MKKDHQFRENYADPSLRFQDWARRLGLEKSPILRFILDLEERFHLRRFLLLILFALILSIAITFEVRTAVQYQAGDVAKNDIVSPLSFEMIDEVTTEERKTKAESSVPVIFDFDPQVFERVSSNVLRSFRLMRAEMKNVNWPKGGAARAEATKEFFVHKAEFDKELGASLSDYIFEWLVEHHFDARFENALIRNLEIWYRDKLVDGIDKNIPTKTNIVLARVVQKSGRGREFFVRKTDLIDSSTDEFFQLREASSLSSREQGILLRVAREIIQPNLTLNRQEMESRRSAARDAVLPVSISLKKNQVLIAEGSIIQPYHVALLKHIEALRSASQRQFQVLAIATLFLSIIIVFFSYHRRLTRGKIRVPSKDLFLMGLISLGSVITTKIFLFLTETSFASKFGNWIPNSMFLYASPVAAGPMLAGLLLHSGEVIWLFSAFNAIVLGVMTEFNFPFMLVALAGGIAGARGVFNCKKRNDIYRAGIRTGLINALVVSLVVLIQKGDAGLSLGSELASTVPAGFLGGILASLVTMMLVPLLESVFNYTTDVKLLELSNLNHPLLKDMIVKAPGTYHHSMMVGSMVEAAAEEIEANPLLGKVMCYYHDIGKMEHSNYFIENQKAGHNPHDHISPFMSKTLLIAHVKDGVELGIEHKLGQPIIDGILMHHGTTLISYFYNKAIDQHGDDEPEISENEFRYPGPKPQFREAALCMLADSIEAASRSLDEPTPIRLQNIVKNIVQRKFMDGQLDECSLTLKDLSRVEAAFTRILLGIYHQRIDYPKSAGGGASEAPEVKVFPGTPGQPA